MTVVDHAELVEFVTRALVASGARELDAALTADVLTSADLAGVDSHGVARLRRYVEGLRSGGIDGQADPEIVQDTGGVVVIDAHNGLGQPALCFAVDLAAQRARELGVAAALVRRSNHIGIAGWFTERAARTGTFAMVTTNATPQVAPTGAADPMFGTNPISYALPTGGDPLCYDGATSIVPRGKLERLHREGREMLPGWALGPDGRTSCDIPKVVAGLKAREGYALLPLGGLGEEHGGHKGYGLGLLAELLCGPLAGASWSSHTYGPDGADLGQFVLCLDIGAVGELKSVTEAVDRFAGELRDARTAREGVPVRLPGDRRHRVSTDRVRHGVPLLPPVVTDLEKIAALTGIPPLPATRADEHTESVVSAQTDVPKAPTRCAESPDSRGGPRLIDLSSGQVVEPLPDVALQAVAEADGLTRYAPGAGMPQLCAAVAEHYLRRGAQAVDASEVTITAGGRHGLSATVRAVADGGDVLIPRPHWSHYPKVVEYAGARAVPVDGDAAGGWLVDPAALEHARTPATRALLLNSPANPTGAVYPEPAVLAIREWAADHDVHLIVDDIYWAYGDSAAAAPNAGAGQTVVGGAAKVHALAGLRVGWIWSRHPHTERIRDVVEHTTGPVSSLAQTATAAVLAAADGTVEGRARRLATQRVYATELFDSVPMLTPLRPTGGIYLCLDATELLANAPCGAVDDRALCAVLAERAGVRLRAGSTFGLPGHLRLCVAEEPELLRTAAVRLTEFLVAATPKMGVTR